MKAFWLDASALVKLISNEPGTDILRRLIRRSPRLETNWLCVAEAYSALKRRCLKERRVSQSLYHYMLLDLRCFI